MKLCPKCNTPHEKPGMFCSRSCANSRVQTEEIKKKKSDSVKKWIKINGHPLKGKPGRTHTPEDKEKIRHGVLNRLKEIGHVNRTPEQLKLKNRVGASKYRARLVNAIQPDSDMNLIKKIFKFCPKGYEVDHIVALAVGGSHHQDNLQYLPEKENQRKSKHGRYNESLAIRWQELILTEAG
jgi:hypothetical protein